VQADRPGQLSGVLTFLFTDIEGSTRRWEADADAMRAALEGHDAVLRDAVDSHAGRLFKHTGDGVCAVFASPHLAVDAAIAAQRAVGLPVRMGIATGEAEARSGDYFGPVLNRAARLMSAGHGGQILLDGAAAGLLDDVDLLALGTSRLRDITNPVALFQVRAPGLRTDFPPLKTADAVVGNLRAPSTSFVGRDREVANVQAELRAHRLVTLTGVGGVGKTRLALEVAKDVSTDFRDGVWFIELAPVADPAAVPGAAAAALGITQQAGLTLTESIAAAMEDRTRLLIIDNCEHVLDAVADLIDAIFGHSSTVTVLATSREALRLNEERSYPVPPLDTRHGTDSSAVALFVDRATSVAPDSSLDDSETASAVLEICRRLDGIALAIELAASRMVSMTVTEVRDRLDDRFRLLVGSRRGLERHQTLRHAVQWSYDLLDDAEQALLQRCSIFAGGFDLDGARAVAGGDDDFAILDLLESLVRKSLVVADRTSRKTRFSMLETIRQFAEDRLAASGAADHTRTAHACFFAGREPDVLAVWDSPRQRDAYRWFGVELANLRTAFRWAADHDDLDAAATIAVNASFFGQILEQYEPVTWAEELLERARAEDHVRLPALYVMAAQCCMVGRVAESIRYAVLARATLGIKEFRGVPFSFGEALVGTPYIHVGEPERWAETCRTQLQSDPDSHGYLRSSLAMAATIAGREEEALAATEGLVITAEATNNPHSISYALLATGFAYRDSDPATALELQSRGLRVAQEHGIRSNESHLAVMLARLETLHGNPCAALDHIELAIRNYHDSGNTGTMRSPLAMLATLFDRLGEYEPAATIAEFGASPIARASHPDIATAITHLRDVLGDQRYESLAAVGLGKSAAAMASYAYAQIDRVRTALT
jgi:predicted ATPase/class 3 adenylate cyclase